jgi:glycogen operon protein
VTSAVTEGSPEPLGVTVVPGGINVAVWSGDASAIEFCLFDEAGQVEMARIVLSGRTGPIFHARIDGVGAGARYGVRAHGPFDPARGLRFDPDKLLLDPYALAIDRPFVLHPSMLARPSEAMDSGSVMPKGIVTIPEAPPPPSLDIPWSDTVIYELHVKGFTQLHPDVPEAMRGTFAGLAHPAAIAHLKRLGVTTVELMPSAAWCDEPHLPRLGLANAWGYNPIAMLAPDPRLAPGGWAEVRALTAALATAGIETLLDVVFNHSGEGDEFGPTLSLRGLDNANYYRLRPDDLAHYVNDAGTGNVIALDRPAPLRLTMDALRAWRRLGGVSGFRFDLATTLGRRADGAFDASAPLLAAIDQDPDLRILKLIAEPWDLGPDGLQLGAFSPAWGEWNDRYREAVRGFWRDDGVSTGELARRLTGSQDIFGRSRPSRSINYVVAHDGFTLADLVAYERKHNEANGEQNRDGTDGNRSWNHGVEGPSKDAAVRAARLADQRALLACLLCARGTPMLAMGSELGRGQGGNNNPYAQDNAINWIDWANADEALAEFTARLIAIRSAHPALRADHFLTGEPRGADPWPDVVWRRADGSSPEIADWEDPHGPALVMVLAEPIAGGVDRVAIAIHRGGAPVEVAPPEPRDRFSWAILADTADTGRKGVVGGPIMLAPRSVVILAEEASSRGGGGVDRAVLSRLARAAGIAEAWWSVDGEQTLVRPDTERALLAAMRLPAETTQQALEALHRLAETHDRRPLPHALVRAAGQVAVVTLAPRDGVAPRTWLNIEGEAGPPLRLRVAAETASETMVTCRDGRAVPGLAVTLPALPPGRYRITRDDAPDASCMLIVAPAKCHQPPLITEGRRGFGVTAQIYSLVRTGDQGIGDFATLARLGAETARRGGVVLGVNPLHARFCGLRDRSSPYYPSDRRFLDPIYLDVNALAPAHAGADIDYAGVWAAKAEILETRFATMRDDAALSSFIAAGGVSLARFAAFEAICEQQDGRLWRAWPAGLRDPEGAAVRAFVGANSERVRFHQFLQWLCERQLADAASEASGLELGFCRDLAIGAAPDGAEAWAQSGLLASGVSLGAPPDPLGPLGQVWGLPPFDPHAVMADGYRAPGELYAANMRHAGALRIDHVLGLNRQFWIPDGAAGADGAYVAYPLDDLLGVLALESERAGCLVIGEDLGTVPDGLRERLAEGGLLTYRVLPFERAPDGAFRSPAAYPVLAWACVATHDLPPLAGWWRGEDITERQQLALVDAQEASRLREDRAADRRALIEALAGAGLIEANASDADGPLTDTLAAAIHAFIAKTPSALALAQVEDIAEMAKAINLPGTDLERANWRSRIATPLEALFETPRARAILDAMRAERA